MSDTPFSTTLLAHLQVCAFHASEFVNKIACGFHKFTAEKKKAKAARRVGEKK
jgi:hypothetical protein